MARPSGNPFKPKSSPLDARRKKLWQALNDYIAANDGWIVSQRDVPTIRFECPVGSSLPDLLKSAGHDPRYVGTHERLLAQTISETRGNRTITSQVVAPGVAEVWQFDLPSTDPKTQRGITVDELFEFNEGRSRRQQRV